MWRLTRCLRHLGAIAAVLAIVGFQGVPAASAAPGNLLANLAPPGAVGGVSVAFDGNDLYYTDLNGVVLHRIAPSGLPASDIPIRGAAGINALSYDARRDVLWAADASGLGIYQIQKDGLATLAFKLVPAIDLPGSCGVATGCSAVVSGLAFDGSNDTLWYQPQLSERIYHFTTAGHQLGYFDTHGASALVPDCLTNGVSGIAAGANALYMSSGSCGKDFRYTKTGSKVGSFPSGGPKSGDLECDSTTFGKDAVWTRDLTDGHLRAVELPAGTCVQGGGVPLDANSRYMVGILNGSEAISQYGTPVPHQFLLNCDQTNPSGQYLDIKWTDDLHNAYVFHLTRVVSATCTFVDPNQPPAPLPAALPICDQSSPDCFTNIRGIAVGSLDISGPTLNSHCDSCGRVDFFFTDNGPKKNGVLTQPPPYDLGDFQVSELTDPNDIDSGAGILIPCDCNKADYRAHLRGVVCGSSAQDFAHKS